MPKTNSGIYDRKRSVKELLGRFLPYYKPYVRVVILDLFFAGLTCGAELVLPQIIKYLTNTAVNDIASLTLTTILKLAALYLVLRAVDAGAAFYMAYQGHVMGTKMETDMRRDAYDHLLRLSDTFYSNP